MVGVYMKRNRLPSSYDSFYKALDIDIALMDNPQDKELLKEFMRNAGYRQTKDEKLYPTTKQLDHAINYINKKMGVQIEFERYMDYSEKKDILKREHIIAERSLIYNGKKYRKGQYLPKGIRY